MGQANFQTITFYHPVLSQLFDHEILRSFPERGRKRENKNSKTEVNEKKKMDGKVCIATEKK